MHIGYQNVVQQCSNWGPQAIVLPPRLSLFFPHESQQEFQTDIRTRISTTGEDDSVSVQDIKANGWTGFMTPLILNIATIWRCVCGQFRVSVPVPPWKSVSVPIEEGLSRS